MGSTMGVKAENMHNEWQYNGIASFEEILKWCWDNLSNNLFGYRGWETIDFFDKEAYILFLMRWS